MSEPVSDLGRRVLEQMPHKRPMLILDDVEEVGPMHIVCLARIGRDHILLDHTPPDRGRISSFAAIELMAQSAAALMVHRALEGNNAPTNGMLLGTRKIVCHRGHLREGDVVRVRAVEKWGAGQLAQFEGRVEIGPVCVAEGSINVMTGTAPA